MKKHVEEFYFIRTNGSVSVYPFRVGDIVEVRFWGLIFDTYTDAFVYFTGKPQKPYFSEKKIRKNATQFKIIGIAEHGGCCGSIVAYVQDRLKHGLVIGLGGLKLIRQFPLRKKEKKIIKLEKIKTNKKL